MGVAISVAMGVAAEPMKSGQSGTHAATDTASNTTAATRERRRANEVEGMSRFLNRRASYASRGRTGGIRLGYRRAGPSAAPDAPPASGPTG